MAYRKTEKVLAGIEKRQDKIIAACIGIIGRSGIEALTTDAVAERADLSVGLIYKYFPDKVEMVARTVASLIERDLSAMREAAAGTNAVAALSAALTVFYNQNHESKPRLVQWLASEAVYRRAICDELTALIRAALDLTPKDAAMAAAGAVGALYGIHGLVGSSAKAVLFALRGIGVSDAVARRVMA